MKNIVVTQRVDFTSGRNEARDSFAHSYYEVFKDCFRLIPIPSKTVDVAGFCAEVRAEGILLTGGNSVVVTDEDYCGLRHQVERKILAYAEDENIPVIGICHGLQFINDYLGGNITKINGHVCSTHYVNFGRECLYRVNSYHDYGIKVSQLAKSLVPLGVADDDTVEMAIHSRLPWIGLMWHPERDIEFQILWFDLINKVFNKELNVNKDVLLDFIMGSIKGAK